VLSCFSFELFGIVRLDRYPQMAGLAQDPGFQALIQAIEADNARMRAQLVAARAAKAPPPPTATGT